MPGQQTTNAREDPNWWAAQLGNPNAGVREVARANINRIHQQQLIDQHTAQFAATQRSQAAARQSVADARRSTDAARERAHQESMGVQREKMQGLKDYRDTKLADTEEQAATRKSTGYLNMAQSPALMSSFGKQAPAIQKALLEQYFASLQGGGAGMAGPSGAASLAALAGGAVSPETDAVRKYRQSKGLPVAQQTAPSPTNAPAGVPQRAGAQQSGSGFIPSQQPGFQAPGGSSLPYVSPQDLHPMGSSPSQHERAAMLQGMVERGEATTDVLPFKGGNTGDINSPVSPDVAGVRRIGDVDPAWLANAQASKANLGYDQYGRIAVIGAGDPSVGALEGSRIEDLGKTRYGNEYKMTTPSGGSITSTYKGDYHNYLAQHPTYRDVTGMSMADRANPPTKEAMTPSTAWSPEQLAAGGRPLTEKPAATNRPFFGSPELVGGQEAPVAAPGAQPNATPGGTPDKDFITKIVQAPVAPTATPAGTPPAIPRPGEQYAIGPSATPGPVAGAEPSGTPGPAVTPEGPQQFGVRMANEVNNPNIQPNLPNPAPPENMLPKFNPQQDAALAAQRAAEEEARRRAAEQAAAQARNG